MIVITGASGLLGKFIAKKIADTGIKVIGLTRDVSKQSTEDTNINWKEADILDIDSLQSAFEGASIVIHAAALVSFNPKKRDLLYQINVDGTRNVVNACLLAGVPRLIHISSIAALGRQKGIPVVDESSKWTDSNLNTNYAESKYLAELEVYRGMEEGLGIDIVNPSVILSRSDWNRSSSQLFKYVWMERPFYTTGLINYVDVRDVAEMIGKMAASNASNERFIANVGSIEIRKLFTGIAQRFNKRAPFIGVSDSMVSVVARLEHLRSSILGIEPIVTTQSARAAREHISYSNNKATIELGMKFRSLQESLDWCCSYYLGLANTNN